MVTPSPFTQPHPNLNLWAQAIPLELWGPKLPSVAEAEAHVPRHVSVERHMRQFAHRSVKALLRDVPSELLRQPGQPGQPRPTPAARSLYDAAPFLPLHVFDDEDYDCRCGAALHACSLSVRIALHVCLRGGAACSGPGRSGWTWGNGRATGRGGPSLSRPTCPTATR